MRRLLLFLRVNGQDVAAEYEWVGDLEVAVATLVQFLGFVRCRVFLKLGWPVEAFPAYGALVRVVFSVHGNDVPFQVTGVGAAMLAVAALVSASVLVCRGVLSQLVLLGEGLAAALAAERQLAAVLCFHVRLQVGRVGRFVIAVQARVRLLASVCAHVFL